MSERAVRAVRLRVTGEVQGVSFRAYAAQEAVRLEVAGWVRNAPDGAVEAHVEGDADPVAEMITWCHQGSPAARVHEVAITDVSPEGLDSFEVRY